MVNVLPRPPHQQESKPLEPVVVKEVAPVVEEAPLIEKPLPAPKKRTLGAKLKALISA